MGKVTGSKRDCHLVNADIEEFPDKFTKKSGRTHCPIKVCDYEKLTDKSQSTDLCRGESFINNMFVHTGFSNT